MIGEDVLLGGEVDAGLTASPPKQRVAMDTPCTLEAAGACYQGEAGGQNELHARDVSTTSDQNSAA